MLQQLENKNYVLKDKDFVSFDNIDCIDKKEESIVIVQDGFLLNNLILLKENENYILIVLNGQEEELVDKLKHCNIYLRKVLFIQRESLFKYGINLFEELKKYLDPFGQEKPVHSELFKNIIEDNTEILTSLYSNPQLCK